MARELCYPASVTQFLAKLSLRWNGWTAEGEKPAATKYVLIAAPHTTNWDLFHLLQIAWFLGVKLSWMGKKSLFRGPMGPVMRALGGIPINRDRSTNMVDQMAAAFADSDSLVLTVPAEGTRRYVPHWKSGFYHIARAAEVPVLLGYLDYARKRGGFGPAIELTGDVSADMDEIRGFYADKVAKYPEYFGEIRLKEER